MGLYQLIIIWFGFHACEYQFNELLICSVLATNRYRKVGSANFLNDESKATLTALFKRLIELFRRCSGCGGGSEAWTGNISASNSASTPSTSFGSSAQHPTSHVEGRRGRTNFTPLLKAVENVFVTVIVLWWREWLWCWRWSWKRGLLWEENKSGGPPL